MTRRPYAVQPKRVCGVVVLHLRQDKPAPGATTTVVVGATDPSCVRIACTWISALRRRLRVVRCRRLRLITLRGRVLRSRRRLVLAARRSPKHRTGKHHGAPDRRRRGTLHGAKPNNDHLVERYKRVSAPAIDMKKSSWPSSDTHGSNSSWFAISTGQEQIEAAKPQTLKEQLGLSRRTTASNTRTMTMRTRGI